MEVDNFLGGRGSESSLVPNFLLYFLVKALRGTRAGRGAARDLAIARPAP